MPKISKIACNSPFEKQINFETFLTEMFTIIGILNEGKEMGEGRVKEDLYYCGKLEFFSVDRIANVCYRNDTSV